jgi:hypothetical protein
VTTFLDSLDKTSYLQIIHFIAKKTTVKNILNIKIFHSSAVLKLLQQKYKLQEDAFMQQNKGPL